MIDEKARKNPELSVIIPVYNSRKTINQCLNAVFSSDFKEFEVIMVDDCSTDDTLEMAKKYPCKVIKLKRNSGPSSARNQGATAASAEILFFIDSDVILNSNALREVFNFYKDEKIHAAIGMYAKESANNGFFHEYMALWKYYTWMYPQAPEYFSFFIASCGSMRRKVFFELNGFNTEYRGTDVEDYELGYRLREKYKIYFNPKIQGKHYHPDFMTCARNYYKRASLWFNLFMKQNSFDNGAASASRGVSSLIGFLIPVLILFAIFFPLLWIAVVSLSVIFVIMNMKFYLLAFEEKGLWFMMFSIAANLILSIFISAGVFKSIISISFLKWI
ncbi:MAG: glycosyltransferase family 2 protein [Candidatus Niyogibacteria bacterium]|nr:glycosyltransferase family 2 protein [Candidatus Niyogibacteria bacterium]